MPLSTSALTCRVSFVALFALSCTQENTPPKQPQPTYPPPAYGGNYPQQPYPPASPPPYSQQPPYSPQQPYPPAPAPTSAPAPQPPPTSLPPPPSTSLPPAPLGSVDLSGSFTAAYLRQEPSSVMAELIAALPPTARTKVQGVPLQISEDPKDVNAFAGCAKSGAPFVAVTAPLLLIMGRAAEARAFDELYGTSKYNELANGFAGEVKGQKAVTGPSAGFLPLPQALDPRKTARQKFLFDEQVAFVVGHELAHHHRGHTGCANGTATSNAVTAQDVGRLLSSAVPLFNQPNEIEADVQGTFNLLDTGAHRQGGVWTEEGAVMTLDFFSRLQSLGVETFILGFLQTHPPPQLRLPIVQNAASQWRSNGGKAPTFPFQLPM